MLKYDKTQAFNFKTIMCSSLLFTIIAIVIGLDLIMEIMNQTENLITGWSIQFVMQVLQKSSIQMLIPIFSTIPFSVSYVEERKSNMMRNVLTRIGKREYLLSKAITTAFSGGVLSVWMSFFFLLIIIIIFGRVEKTITDLTMLHEILHPFGILMIRFFVIGAFWGELGLVMSAWLKQRLMAWISPFIMYYLLVIICERYLKGCYVIYPLEWANPSLKWPLEQWAICFWLLFLTIMMGIVFYLIGEKELQNI